MVKPDLFTLTPIGHVTHQPYEHYLPTAFNESMSLLQKVNKMIHEMNRMGLLMNDFIKQWNELIKWIIGEGLEGMVEDKLQEWYENGKLADLIDSVLFNRKADKTTVNKIAYVFEGTTADELQLLLNLAKLTPYGVTIKIPNGTYKMNKLLRVYSNTHLILDKNAVILRNHTGNILCNGDKDATYNGNSGHGNITIEGGIFDGNIENMSGGFNIFSIGRARNITLRDITFKDCAGAHAIDLVSSRDVLIQNCRFVGYRVITVDSNSSKLEAIQIGEHTRDGFQEFGNFDGSGCENVVIDGCYFGESGTNNTTAYPTAIGHHSAVYGKYHQSIKVTNCTFDKMTYAGIHLFKHSRTIIMGNYFKDCERGVFVSTPWTNSYSTQDENGVQRTIPESLSDLIISDNTFLNTAYSNIIINGYGGGGHYSKVKNVLIRGNIFGGASVSRGVEVMIEWADKISVLDNVFNKNKRIVEALYVNDLTIKGNTSEVSDWEGIFIYENSGDEFFNQGLTNNVTISENRINKTQFVGINLQYVKGFFVLNNLLDSIAIADDNTRNAIQIANCSEGRVSGNRVKKAKTGNQNKYGIEVTGTCEKVQVVDNTFEGKTKPTSISADNGNFVGVAVPNPDGTQQYAISVLNDGTFYSKEIG